MLEKKNRERETTSESKRRRKASPFLLLLAVFYLLSPRGLLRRRRLALSEGKGGDEKRARSKMEVSNVGLMQKWERWRATAVERPAGGGGKEKKDSVAMASRVLPRAPLFHLPGQLRGHGSG